MNPSSTYDQFDREREDMVRTQLESRGISSPDVLKAMRTVPREEFVAESAKNDAYRDGPLPIGYGQTISQPYMVALMTSMLSPEPSHKILEIGTGSGYQMAVLLELTDNVYSIERIPELADRARENLVRSGYRTGHILNGDGSAGLIDKAPFDGIIVTSGSPSVPEILKSQLSLNGRLVIPVGTRHLQTLYCISKTASGYITDESTQCVFVPLIGEHGWE